MSNPTLRIAVLCEAVQLTDIVGIDFFGNISTEYITACAEIMGPSVLGLLPLAPTIEFCYLARTLAPTPMTPGIHYTPTHTYATAPRNIDIILVGGPLPSSIADESLVYLREAAAESPEAVIMSTCIGAGWLASAGLLEGRRATTNRGELERYKERFPDVRWERKRWVVDGRFWTSAGAGCGADMVLAFMKGRWDERLMPMVVEGLQLTVDESPEYKD